MESKIFENNGMVSATAAAAMIGKSTSVLYTYAERFGFPKPRWIGGARVYSAKEIEAWLSAEARYDSPRVCGEDHPNNKWPAKTVARAVQLYNNGDGSSLGYIAQKLGVPKATVHKWVNGERRALNVKDATARTKAAAKAATNPPKRRELPAR